ncbi:hypothetical protein CDL12_28192 [Handroanthus impetiginosus]|uniref:Uncharacterized protein n=1 Tax=Handroanthus impetiginosus TaxID=429701 RepID=A0A2G9G1W1_9LAMI|nr:hypothetical protein CDL12_28192 [Handroanthus impetiginosus]
MEVAIIDWKNIDSRFVKDELYEHINAPKWVDFSTPDDPVDDEAWFCRPGCNHPKTAEDFFNEKEKTPTSNSKLQRSASVCDISPFGDKNKRDATLKKRGINQPFALLNKDMKHNRVVEDGENQDPNFSTPRNHKVGKEAIKSSTEKKQNNERKEQIPKLRSTLSARNLFSGGDLLNKVSEFCNELKKLATRPRDKENGNNVEKHEVENYADENSGTLNDKEKERKPLLELSKEKSEVEKSGSKSQLRRKKRNDDAENTPISVDVKNVKHQEAENLLQIRTYPPTPQCFSASRGPPKATTPMPFRPMNQERGILQEVKKMNKEEKTNHGGEIAEKEVRSLDVFWFLKPCTLSS